MKKINFLGLFLAVALVAGALQFGPTLRAQDQNQNPPAGAQQRDR